MHAAGVWYTDGRRGSAHLRAVHSCWLPSARCPLKPSSTDSRALGREAARREYLRLPGERCGRNAPSSSALWAPLALMPAAGRRTSGSPGRRWTAGGPAGARSRQEVARQHPASQSRRDRARTGNVPTGLAVTAAGAQVRPEFDASQGSGSRPASAPSAQCPRGAASPQHAHLDDGRREGLGQRRGGGALAAHAGCRGQEVGGSRRQRLCSGGGHNC